MSSSSSSSSSSDQPLHEHLCYVHCNICDTVLAVSVPSTSLSKTVTVRCGHCTTLLPVHMPLLFPSLGQFHSFVHNQNPTGEIQNPSTNHTINESSGNHLFATSPPCPRGMTKELPRSHQVIKRPQAKRQRVPSAYNRFIKEEIQRIKAENPNITHREAFSAAAKNWAHFPHIQFGLAPDQLARRSSIRHQEGEDPVMKDVLLASANVGMAPAINYSITYN
ncbi:PREDICTED: axial regulator YABBY 5-like [Tarenaya hassleriana]|uniref:axial regulator YABBY 5-like n=1 Tax=Tarenaya hassleriana TaxID=28532 RepID=UPI00053C100A|nr:PREDICTED: axial regulator YABBY 5-like [Tarenaya hassleriana]